MNRFAALGVMLVVGSTATLAGATPHEYYGGVGDVILLCDGEDGSPGVGGVCIPPGHMMPGPSGDIILTIDDDLSKVTSGFICQDSDANGICEGAIFCGSIVLNEANYDGSATLFVHIDGILFGNPALSACSTLSAGTHGFVYHT